MCSLYLSEPTLVDFRVSEEQTNGRVKVHRELEELFKSALFEKGKNRIARSQLIIWLGESLADLNVSDHIQRRIILQILRNLIKSFISDQKSHSNHQSIHNLLHSVLITTLETKPAQIGIFLKSKSSLFIEYFSGQSYSSSSSSSTSITSEISKNRITKWFDNFDISGAPEKGAKALEQYLLANRDRLWNKIIWKKNSVGASPIIAVQVRSRFFEMDVYATVQMLIQEHPEFFESDQFQRSLSSDEYVKQLDCDQFAWCLEKDIKRYGANVQMEDAFGATITQLGFKEIWKKWVCMMEDESVFSIVNDLRNNRQSISKQGDCNNKDMNEWVLCECNWDTIRDIYLWNALNSFGHPLLKLVQSLINEDHEVEDCFIDLIPLIIDKDRDSIEHWKLRKEWIKRANGKNEQIICKELLLEAMILRIRLIRLKGNRRQLRHLMRSENVDYHTMNREDILQEKKPKTKKHKKSSKHSSKLFVGWRFKIDQTGFTSTITSRDSSHSVKRKNRSADDYTLTYTEEDVGEYLSDLTKLLWFRSLKNII